MGDTDQAVAEPFEGYATADITTIEQQIANTAEGDARETLKEAIRTAEIASGAPRKGVLAATEPAAAEAPAEDDTSGRPDLGAIAADRAGSRRVRVIDTPEGK